MIKSVTFYVRYSQKQQNEKIRGNYDLMYEGEIFEMNHSTSYGNIKEQKSGSK